MKRLFSIFLFLGLVMFVPACTQVIEQRVFSIHDIAEPDDFGREIKRLRELETAATDDAERSDIHLKLAVMYSHHKNPRPDYSRALAELKEHVSLDPEGGERPDVQNWLAVLETLSKEKKARERMEVKTAKLRSDIDRLERERKLMEETIEKLKYLDIRLEEKRRQVK